MAKKKKNKDLEELGERLEELLRERDLTQEKVGIQSTVSRIRNALVDPRYTTLKGMAEEMNMAVCEMLCQLDGNCCHRCHDRENTGSTE